MRLLTALCLPALLAAQSNPVWKPLEFLVGSWEGLSQGRPGDGKVERTYQFVLNGRFLQARNKSVYAPQPRNAKGEVHEDWSMISYDGGRKRFVFRQFHVEGFVNQYVVENLPEDGKPLVFLSEGIENIPPGWRARETYRVLGPDEFTETFELAAPGGAFEVYSESRFKRKKPPER